MKEARVELACRGRDSNGLNALNEPIELTVRLNMHPESNMISATPEGCPYNTGSHGERCKASHRPGEDKEGEGVICPFSFDYPDVKRFDRSWRPPADLIVAALQSGIRIPPDGK